MFQGKKEAVVVERKEEKKEIISVESSSDEYKERKLQIKPLLFWGKKIKS
jgi:hypothetical protein